MQSDKMAHSGAKPDVAYLITEFQKCAPINGVSLLRTDQVRFCKWAGQTTDGRKRDTKDAPAFPFDGASDTRVMLADQIINERVAILTTSFWRGMFRPKAAETEASQYAVRLADHFVNSELTAELIREVELAAQYREHYGWFVVHTSWEQKVRLKKQEVSLADLAAVGLKLQEAYPDNPLFSQLPAAIRAYGSSSLDELLLQTVQTIYRLFAREHLGGADMDADIPELRKDTLAKALRELRDEGEAEVPVPYLCRNRPMLRVLRPWDEVFVPGDTTSLQEARVIYQREWVTEAELRARVNDREYDKAWVEEAVKQKGKSVTAFWSLPEGTGGSALTGTTAVNQTITQGLPIEHNYIELLHCVRRTVDADGVPGVWLTTVHPGLRDTWAVNELLEYPHGEYPYVEGAREFWCRCFTSSRGVPEVVYTWQNELKGLRDAMIDRTSMTVMPPINEYHTPLGTKYRFGPGIRNTVVQGKEPAFMQMPSGQGMMECLEAQDRLNAAVDNYFGLLSAKVPPARTQAMQAMMVQNWMLTWSSALQQLVGLAQCYMPDKEFARITGAPEGWLESKRGRFGMLAVDMHFDVRELDPELVAAKLEIIGTKVLPGDAAGIISRAKLTEMQMRAIDPRWAKELIVGQTEASGKLYQDVKNELVQMFAGNEPQYVENDPTAQAKLQYTQAIIAANPNYQQALQQGGRFADLVQNWIKNLTQSVMQEQNKQIGRIGVAPVGAGSS